MSNTAVSLRRKIATASDLIAIVRTMKAIAASSIHEYENAVSALEDYNRAVQLALLVGLRQKSVAASPQTHEKANMVAAVIFGSDQGLVGQFNERLVDFAVQTLSEHPCRKRIWTVGERIQTRLDSCHLDVDTRFELPNSLSAITAMVSQIRSEIENRRIGGDIGPVYLFHNHPVSGATFEPNCLRLLPLDEVWYREIAQRDWPTQNLPEVIQGRKPAIIAFVQEYIFVSLFRACAESLASENACRLIAMQRAEKNIENLLETLGTDFHRLRQRVIDEELFDVIAGFESYGTATHRP
ncbi:F0F1 ATP synthase subunit gamma [Photobacterium sp. Hal280]|uniref:F0F1 ATP synthase subunit gamma n=1 Tax=Photobacterium sp. Hal280 TaxID=3035163 RepID=UPI00301CE7B3